MSTTVATTATDNRLIYFCSHLFYALSTELCVINCALILSILCTLHHKSTSNITAWQLVSKQSPSTSKQVHSICAIQTIKGGVEWILSCEVGCERLQNSLVRNPRTALLLSDNWRLKLESTCTDTTLTAAAQWCWGKRAAILVQCCSVHIYGEMKLHSSTIFTGFVYDEHQTW